MKKIKPRHHWQLQRLSALFLVLTLPFLGIFLLTLKGANYHQAMVAVRHPALSAFLGLIIAVSLYHAALGLQVIVRDYLRGAAAKITLGSAYTAISLMMVITLYSLIGIISR